MQKDELDTNRPNSTSGPRCPQKSYGGRGHGGGGVCMGVGREERRGEGGRREGRGPFGTPDSSWLNQNIDVDLSLSVVEHSKNKVYLLRAWHVRNKFDEK